LYKKEESDSDSGSNTEAAEPPTAQSLMAWWTGAARSTITAIKGYEYMGRLQFVQGNLVRILDMSSF
jgi:hypothetical protein